MADKWISTEISTSCRGLEGGVGKNKATTWLDQLMSINVLAMACPTHESPLPSALPNFTFRDIVLGSLKSTTVGVTSTPEKSRRYSTGLFLPRELAYQHTTVL